MSAFEGMEDVLQDFLVEAGDMLSDVDNKLLMLEQSPADRDLLNVIFRDFHTIKGGAGFLNALPLVALCHRTENLFDKLRNAQLRLTPEIMDVILAATAIVRDMFATLTHARMPDAADPAILQALDAVLAGETPPIKNEDTHAAAVAIPSPIPAAHPNGPDWPVLYHALMGSKLVGTGALFAQGKILKAEESPRARAPTTATPSAKENTIRIDTTRLDQVLNLSGEIGLTKNRLTCLRSEMMAGRSTPDTLKALDEAVSQLDVLVSDLQNAVMKTRMQPIGRLFQKYPRLARDLARSLGKDVELIIEGEDTEIDKTMIEDLNDPLVHLVRNAVDHGIDSPAERAAAGKPAKSLVKLTAHQIGDHIVIEISDDGRGMHPDALRKTALENGLIDAETADSLDERQSLNLVFLPGFSTKDTISDVSGRGVGMDVVKTNITKLNGRIDVTTVIGQGSVFTITLPLTLAILPVLIVRLGTQPFAIPLSMVREIMPINPQAIQQVAGRATLVVRDEVLPVRTLAGLLDWPESTAPAFGVLMQSAETAFVLAIDGFIGRDDVVIKPLTDIKPRGIAGATLSGNGSVVLVLDIETLLLSDAKETRASLFVQTG